MNRRDFMAGSVSAAALAGVEPAVKLMAEEGEPEMFLNIDFFHF